MIWPTIWIGIWPTIWLGILITGIIGFLQVVCGVTALTLSIRTAINEWFDLDFNKKWRSHWLIEHFGEHGAKYWLLNKKSSELLIRADAYRSHMNGTNWFNMQVTRDSIRAHQLLQALWAKYPWLDGEVCRGPNGTTQGTIIMNWGGQSGDNSWVPPWGEDHHPYPVRHLGERDHKLSQPYNAVWNWYHGEPSWHDWMASGNYDRGRRLLVLDAIDMARSGGISTNITGFGCLSYADREAIDDEVRAIVHPSRKKCVNDSQKSVGAFDR